MNAVNTVWDAFNIFWDPEQVTEVRVLGLRKGVALGFFDDAAKLEAAIRQHDGTAKGIYVTLNPVNPDLLGRAHNRLIHPARSGDGTSDRDILRRKWLLIDADPVRPSGISSTEAEHEVARQRIQAVSAYLTQEGLPEPILCDSGNGYHLLYRIDLPNDDVSLRQVEQVLAALDLRFSDQHVIIDTNVANAARIVKAYGTLVKKGDETEDRPHRRSSITRIPAHVATVPSERLSAIATLVPASGTPPKGKGKLTRLDVSEWLRSHDLTVAQQAPWQGGGYKWILETCPWNAAHTNRSAYIVQFANGAIAAGCHHNGCANKNWEALRALFAPHAQQPNQDPAGAELEDQRDQVVKELNKDHLVIHVGKKTRKTVVGHDAEFPPTFESFESFRNFHLNDRILVRTKQDGTPVTESVATIWLKHPDRRTFTGDLVFAPPPMTCRPQDYNLWKGFGVSPDPDPHPEQRCQRFLAHLRDVICGQEESDVYEFLLDVLAAKVQRPAELTEVAIVLRGEQGAGKNTFANEFGALFGDRHWCAIEKLDQVTGRFNAALSSKLVVVLDEAVWPGNREFTGALKALVTSPRLMIERKGIDPEEEINAIQTFVLTNNQWAWPAELKDRRALVLDVSSNRVGQTNYFGAIRDEMNNGGREALLAFLEQREITHNLRRIPHTKAKGAQEDLSHDPVTRWWKAKLDRGHTWDEGDTWESWISTKDAYDDYRNSLTRLERPIPLNSFINAWKKLLPNPEMETNKRTGIIDRDERLELHKRGRAVSEGTPHRRPGLTIPTQYACCEAYHRLAGTEPGWQDQFLELLEVSPEMRRILDSEILEEEIRAGFAEDVELEMVGQESDSESGT
jgi:hypothetical protein